MQDNRKHYKINTNEIKIGNKFQINQIQLQASSNKLQLKTITNKLK